MKKIIIRTEVTRMLADIHTPVGIYLRLRDRFRDTILLESTDNRAAENSYSFICVNAIGGAEVRDFRQLETKLPGGKPQMTAIADPRQVPAMLWDFMHQFEMTPGEREARFAQGLYGYTSYDAVKFFEPTRLNAFEEAPEIPLMRYRLYQYVIAINHFRDELFLCENRIEGMPSESALLLSLIGSRDVPQYPFSLEGAETSSTDDAGYVEMVKKGIAHCHRGDVFQIVLSRRFRQGFRGDEFNVYRALRSINPSPYLFFFDYGDYRLMGSSPESQLIIAGGKAVVHPIAGTFRRTGDDATDQREAARLLDDPKENAEHVMLVDLARNDLSRVCDGVTVASYRQVHYYSHVIHLVSEVTGEVRPDSNPFELMARTFPAGTLSGAPKVRAMELIDQYEQGPRSFYGGAIGFVGFDGGCNQAIMIRSLLSKQNTLVYQAGAGVVASSNPDSERQEVDNKLGALKKAIVAATRISNGGAFSPSL
jgi:anthranilate synthase component 1